MSTIDKPSFILMDELHKTVVQSLTTTFGLDFLLFEDKLGGDVDTIHNVRKNIYATKAEKEKYESLEKYNKEVKDKYQQDSRYRNKRKSDNKIYESGNLSDGYSGKKLNPNSKKPFQLDHIIPTSEIHNDPGRVLAGPDGVDLANSDDNFQSTYWAINKAKSNHKIEDFINKELPKCLKNNRNELENLQNKLKNMPSETAQQQHERREIESKIAKKKDYIEALESIDVEKMRQIDKNARNSYNRKIAKEYYQSSKFLKNTAHAALTSGYKMGLRQVFGIVLAEVWFELKAVLPKILHECQQNFKLDDFVRNMTEILQKIWQRVCKRFSDLTSSFKDGLISGTLSSLMTTLFNIFATTQKLIIKLMREMWHSLTKSLKLLFFNPNGLSTSDLIKEVVRLLGTGIAVAMGVILNQHLSTILLFPFGSELAAFISALATGIMTLGITYFLDYSATMQKVWGFLERFKTKYEKALEHYQEINQELDRYLLNLAKIEFNMNPEELRIFTDELAIQNSEFERGLVLKREVLKRNIELPFETGNEDSVRNWLKKL